MSEYKSSIKFSGAMCSLFLYAFVLLFVACIIELAICQYKLAIGSFLAGILALCTAMLFSYANQTLEDKAKKQIEP